MHTPSEIRSKHGIKNYLVPTCGVAIACDAYGRTYAVCTRHEKDDRVHFTTHATSTNIVRLDFINCIESSSHCLHENSTYGVEMKKIIIRGEGNEEKMK